MFKLTLWRLLAPSVIICGLSLYSMAQTTTPPDPPLPTTPTTPATPPTSLINFTAKSPNERMEMTVHTSRIITIGQKIPQAQVNNPDILDLTPLSPTQVQVSAKTTGVTQVNLWGEDKKVYTIDVIVYGDASELNMMLKSQFPKSALSVTPVGNSVLLSGYVDKPVHIDRIVRIAEEYYPKVINNMTVGGVQTVLLHVKVMEVSRTKLRRLGMDWAQISGSNVFLSGPNALLVDSTGDILSPPGFLGRSTTPGTLAFNVVQGNNAFYGVLDAMRQDKLLKVTAEPTLVAESGQEASFNVGGKVAFPTPQGLGTVAITFQEYGTNVVFLPIVLGNGKIHLEVRPTLSAPDWANGTTIMGTTVPGFLERKAATAVELTAGQTLAIAGLVQCRSESESSGLPWISEVPYLGAAFGKKKEQTNEIEMLMMVTPELVDAMDASEVPQCGPGMNTTSPTDWELYMKGHLEVPNCCPNGEGCSNCKSNGNGSPTPVPDDGMIGPEQIQTPAPSGASKAKPGTNNRNTPVMTGPAKMAQRPSGSSTSYNRNSPSKTTGTAGNYSNEKSSSPPGFIGPVGYDVVK